MDSIVLTKPVYIKDRHCGYCKNEKVDFYALESWKQRAPANDKSNSVTMGTELEHIRCEDYDLLMNRGFRRSGVFLYKTDQLRNCCRYYTIRTNLKQLHIEKKHRQVVNRFIRAICGYDNKAQGKFDLSCLIQAETESRTFHTRFEPSEFTEEKFNLYKKYQVSVHNDKPESITKSQFTRFLCGNPFAEGEQAGSDEEWAALHNWKSGGASCKRIGPTHECYYLNDKLIAISILDFLPSGISSIYFIWDPDYAHLSLGSLSGLREILMADKLGYKYYYLGYYIDDCVKMKYKGKFGGEILDLVNSTYYPISQVKPLMVNGRFFVMGNKGDDHEPEVSSDFPSSSASNSASAKHVNVADDIYREETLKDADDTLRQLQIKYKYSTEFPSVIPGLVPLNQLARILAEIEDSQFVIYSLKAGVYRKPFCVLSKQDKSSIINCIRLFGLELTTRMIVIQY